MSFLINKNFFSIKNLIIYCIYFFPISFLFGNFFVNLNLILSIFFFLLYFKNLKNLNLYTIELILLILFFIINLSLDIFLGRDNIIKTLGLLRYFVFGLLISYFIYNEILNLKKYQIFVLGLIFFICCDGLFQYFFGFNIIGIKNESDYISSFFGKEKILGSYLSKILVFSIPILVFKVDAKKIFFLFFILFIILTTTERMGLFNFLFLIFTSYLIIEKGLKKNFFSILISFSILFLVLIFF